MADGIVHLAAYPAPDLVPDTETFNDNVAMTYNVLNSAYHAGVKKVVLASSIGAFGLLRPIVDWYPEYLPIDEAHPCKPQDSYGLSKLVGEKIADSFASKSDMTICSLRLPGFGFDSETFRERWENPAEGRKRLWTYIDTRDAATACRLGLEANFEAHEVFAVSAAGTHDYRSTNELIGKYLPLVKDVRKDQPDNWSCVDGSKAERMLHFKPKHRWEETIHNK
jgi:nucleoside-diphosphate-sugar epimerase